ncbi:phosphate ABC transporter, permease protein PtsA [Gloeomargarita lithophora Alchichica-D10]|uniref:Phosphate transport system permease protein PstA n=1 Tax=Gloeomargarita lithophora Alchichica-D10 TaxID=1188229 RepID=A0A1J0ABY1_9CYAN|nr:phosphate ABC transporter permease PstA [Gloeomargarita lithophora]APB33435.1 phosphate ABC transporter, permease protein PtsA [Gloeomargarita lithophora Alchichica-D10]
MAWVRRGVDGLLSLLVALAVVGVMAVLAWVLGYVSYRGGTQILRGGWAIFTALPPAPLGGVGGFGPALVGSLILITLAVGMALPVSVLAALYLSEFCAFSWLVQVLNLGLDILAGIPSIMAGVFIFGVVIVHTRTFSALAGSLALALLIMPILTTATRLALGAVPGEIRQGAWALGATRWQMVTGILLPQAWPAIVSGLTLGIARAVGETAPLLFTALFSSYYLPVQALGIPALFTQPLASLPVLIYTFALSPFANQQDLAWAAALVLILCILGLNLLARWGERT